MQGTHTKYAAIFTESRVSPDNFCGQKVVRLHKTSLPVLMNGLQNVVCSLLKLCHFAKVIDND